MAGADAAARFKGIIRQPAGKRIMPGWWTDDFSLSRADGGIPARR